MGKKSKRPGRQNKPPKNKGTASSAGTNGDDDDDVERIAEELTDMLVQKKKNRKRNGEIKNDTEADDGTSNGGGKKKGDEEWSPAFSIQDLTPEIVRERTGFANIVGMLQFIAVCVGGDLDVMGQQVSPTGMTVLEEWLAYFEVAFDGGTKKKIWDDYKKDYRVESQVLQEVFKSKLHTVLEMQRRYKSPSTHHDIAAIAGGGRGPKQWNETIGKSKKVPRFENLDDDDEEEEEKEEEEESDNTHQRRRRRAMKVPRNSRNTAGQTISELAVMDSDLNRAWAFQVNFMEAKHALAIT